MEIKSRNSKLFFYLVFLLALFSMPILYFFIDSIVDSDFNSDDIRILEQNLTDRDIEDNSRVKEEFNIDEVKNFLDEELKKEQERSYLSEIKDFQDSILESAKKDKQEGSHKKLESSKKIVESNQSENVAKKPKDDRPKLAIIIDDVAFKFQVKRIRKLGMPITMSMFPADINHPNTSKFANEEAVQMVHLPLEAFKFKKDEIGTLKATDTYETIESRVEQIRKQFPYLRYVNNHTGSKFTSNYGAMKALIKILKDRGITFVDSVTTNKSKSKRVCKELGVICKKRDIFIDNRLNVEYIEKQIRLSVKIAKKYGKAIAIGHPHKKTIEALKNMKEYLLQNVKLVYIDGV